MAVQEAAIPQLPLHRIARGNPLAWPDWSRSGSNRFDDPLREYRVLYATEERRTCFMETLAPLRPNLAYLAALAAMPAEVEDEDPPVGVIGEDWHTIRSVGSLRLLPNGRWLDLQAAETREELRRELATELVRLGLTDLDAGDILARARPVTQIISRWAYERRFHGVAYGSRFDPGRRCWAIFEWSHYDSPAFEPLSIERISADDPDLQAALALFGLRQRR